MSLQPRSAEQAAGAEHPGEDKAPEKEELWLCLWKVGACFPSENKSACKRWFLADTPVNHVTQTTPCQRQDCLASPDAFFSPLPVAVPTCSRDLTAADEAVGEHPLSRGDGNENATLQRCALLIMWKAGKRSKEFL